MKHGDVVYLKSGGPSMTVSHPSDKAGMWYCAWFSDDDIHQFAFHQDALELVGDANGEPNGR